MLKRARSTSLPICAWRSGHLKLSSSLSRHPLRLIKQTPFVSALRHHTDCHVDLFMVPLSVLGLALPWAKLHETVGTSALVWQVNLFRMV